MSDVYLIRHGQAGTRDRYDALSDLGRKQARCLGEYLAREGVVFHEALSGALRRQRETAEEVQAAYLAAGVPFPELQIEPDWNEFDLDAVYGALAPALAREDGAFRDEFERLKLEIAESRGDPEAAVHRRWTPCDLAVIRAWIEDRYPSGAESWPQFLQRVRGCYVGGNGSGAGEVAVFTSATPAAVHAGMALGIADDRLLRIAGVLYNASFSVLRRRGEMTLLFSLNNVPHLPSPELRTHR